MESVGIFAIVFTIIFFAFLFFRYHINKGIPSGNFKRPSFFSLLSRKDKQILFGSIFLVVLFIIFLTYAVYTDVPVNIKNKMTTAIEINLESKGILNGDILVYDYKTNQNGYTASVEYTKTDFSYKKVTVNAAAIFDKNASLEYIVTVSKKLE